MVPVVDLDAVLVELIRRVERWQERGLTAGPWTWRDASTGWPQPILADRALVHDPESLGVALEHGDDHAEFVLWRGGWADLGGLIGTTVIVDAPGFADVASCVKVVDDFIERLVGRPEPWAA